MDSRIVKAGSVLMFCIIVLVTACKKETQVSAPPPEIPVTEVIQMDVPLSLEFVGQVYGLYDIPIRARVEGFLESLNFAEGAPVSRGELLYTIDPQPMEAEVANRMSQLTEAKTMLVRAENELRRIEPLAEINAVSQRDLDAAIAERDAMKASVSAAEANVRLARINLGYTKIYSPINGIIGKTQAKVGEFVGRDPNPVILNTVSRIDSLRVEFFLTETQYLAVNRNFISAYGIDLAEAAERPKSERKSNIDLILADGSMLGQKGRIDFVNREIDPSTGSILLQASFPNPSRIVRPGQFARVSVQFETIEGGLLVPQRCVKELQGRFQVMVVTPDNTIQTRDVQLGSTYKNLWLVTDGLSPGENIVLEGIQRVRDGMVVTPKPSEFEIIPPVSQSSE